MPELPEVQTTVQGLKDKVLNRTFVDIWTDTPKIIKKDGVAGFRKKIIDKKINNVWRRGKNIIFDLSGGLHLLVHQKMTGHLLYDKWEEDKVNSYIRLKFFLDNGKVLALSDLRKFAKVELLSEDELEKELSSLGQEPLDENFTFDNFKKALKRGKIKQVLMRQELIAGIGNIYSDEILWRSGVNPFRDASKLSEKELKNIYKAMKSILRKGVRLRGTSISDYRDIEGKMGNFGNVRKVYRKEGQKCSRCGDIIKRKKIGGRSAHFCPACQPL